MSESTLEPQLAQWRARLEQRPGVSASDVDELTDHLLTTFDHLRASGLSDDEAFLVAVKRVGAQNEVARAFAVEHFDRLWKQLVLEAPDASVRVWRPDGLAPMLVFAALAGLALRIPFAISESNFSSAGAFSDLVLVAMLGLFAVVVGYFSWLRRPIQPRVVALALGAIAVFSLAEALYPFNKLSSGQTQWLFLIHVPIVLWLAVGASWLGRDAKTLARWMDYVRFTGEFLVYYCLIAFGGGVLMGLAAAIFGVVGFDASSVMMEWVTPIGAGGAVIVASWLVEAKKSIVENMAPVLAAVFTPLFTALMLVFLAVVGITGRVITLDRGVLIVVDLVLVVVLGLLLFSISARPSGASARASDWITMTLIVSALVVDALLGAALIGRIAEYGASPNKLAAVGENLVLAVNLAVSGWLYVGFLSGRRRLASLERWQCRYLPVIGGWALVVALVFPPVFGWV